MISPQEQFRILADVVRRHSALRLLTVGEVAIFPTRSISNGLGASFLAIFVRGEYPAVDPQQPSDTDLGYPAVNGWKLTTWTGGACVTVRFALSMDSQGLRTLLEAGAAALDAVTISAGS